MSTDRQSERHGHDGFAEFTEELRLLAEVLLSKVEPVLRRTAADGQADLGGCAWCPVCAAAALVRGDHHDVVAALADHGTSMVTVLREALAGIPVEPVLPPEWSEHTAGHQHSTDDPGAATRGQSTGPDQTTADQPPQTAPRNPDTKHAAGADPRWGTSRQKTAAAPRPRRVDEYSAPRTGRAPQAPHIAPEPGNEDAAGTDTVAATAPSAAQRREQRTEDRQAGARAPRSHYVDIPVTIRG